DECSFLKTEENLDKEKYFPALLLLPEVRRLQSSSVTELGREESHPVVERRRSCRWSRERRWWWCRRKRRWRRRLRGEYGPLRCEGRGGGGGAGLCRRAHRRGRLPGRICEGRGRL
ncbi:hypothetical protein LINGRAHAP2_LOCUS15488, partial [Linum grandiflorum]